MDPFSITTGCFALILAVADASSKLRTFAKTYRDRRSDLAALSSRLDELQRILDLVNHDDSLGTPTTQLAFQKSQEQLNKCLDVLETLPRVLEEYDEPFGGLQWAWKGKKRIDDIMHEVNKAIDHFNLSLGIYDSSLTRDIKYDTSAILKGQVAMLAGLDALRDQLASPIPRRSTLAETMSDCPFKYATVRHENAGSLSVSDTFWQLSEDERDCLVYSESSIAGSEDGEGISSSAHDGSETVLAASCIDPASNEIFSQCPDAYSSDSWTTLPQESPGYYQKEFQPQFASISLVGMREQCYVSETQHCATKQNIREPASPQADDGTGDRIRASFKATVWASARGNSSLRRRLEQPATTQVIRVCPVRKAECDEKAVTIRAKFKEMVQARVRPSK